MIKQQSSFDAAIPRSHVALFVLTALAASLVVVSSPLRVAPPTFSGAVSEERAVEGYGNLPISFEQNVGQAPDRFDFLARGQGFGMAIDATGATLSLGATKSQDLVTLDLVGADRSAIPSALESLPGKVNYFVGDDPSEWHSDISTFGRVSYSEVLPGIDVTYYGTNDGTLEYDFVVAPGADPNEIRVAFSGADDISLRNGALVLATDNGEIAQQAPVLYQTIAGRRVPVEGHFALHNDEVGFQVGSYDRAYPLVIDPTLIYSTFLGGDVGYDIEVNGSGETYIVGTTGPDYPTTAGAFDTTSNGASQDAFVTKLNATGTALIYATYLGGTMTDQGNAVAVDGAGAAYVAGLTFGGGFPTTAGAFDETFSGGNTDGFITKLAPDGSSLAYSTFIGAGGDDGISDIAVDATGAAYLAGSANNVGFPTTGGAFDTTFAGSNEATVTKLAPSGASLVYSTFLGGAGDEHAYAIEVDGAGAAFVSGRASTDFPTTSGAFDTTPNGDSDAFATKVNATGTDLTYSTYLGGTSFDQSEGIALDGTGAAYVSGQTGGAFPTTAGAFDTTFNGNSDAFVSKLNDAGSALDYSTYIGGPDWEWAEDIALDSGAVYVTGIVETAGATANFPTTPGAFDESYNEGFADAFVSRLDASGATLTYSTYLGGTEYDEGFGIAVDSFGAAYVTGDAYNPTNFPTTAGAFDTTHTGDGSDAFVTKLGVIYPVAVTRSGTGSGVVTSVPAGVICGSDCSESYIVGTSVTLTATADPGSTFTGWSEDCSGAGTCPLTMSDDRSVTATFTLDPPPPPPPPGPVITPTPTITATPAPTPTITPPDPLPGPRARLGIHDNEPVAGSKVVWRTRVMRCEGNRRTYMELHRKIDGLFQKVERVRLDWMCKATFTVRVDFGDSVFRAVWVKQNEMYRKGRSTDHYVSPRSTEMR